MQLHIQIAQTALIGMARPSLLNMMHA